MLQISRNLRRFSYDDFWQPVVLLLRGSILSLNESALSLTKDFSSESSDLPNWFNFPIDEEDDFTLSTISDFSVRAVNRVKVDVDPPKMGRNQVNENTIEKICAVLANRFSCPEAVVEALSDFNPEISENLVDQILRRFNHDWIPALGFFRWAKRQSGYEHVPSSYNSMIDILGKSKQFETMWVLVDEMSKFDGFITLSTMSKIMRRLAGAGKWDEAINTFHKIEDFGVSRDTSSMNLLLDSLCKERCTERANDLFTEIRCVIPPNSHTFNVLIHGWCKARRLDEAMRTLHEMKQCGFEPCVISYTTLIEAYCADKNFRLVKELLDEMKVEGCHPNIVTYTIIMHSLGKSNDPSGAFQVYEEMKMNGCIPDTPFYNSLIYILCKAGRLRDANNLYEEMSSRGITPDVTTYNTLIASACEHSREEDAINLLKKMEVSSCKPNLKTYHPLLKLYCKMRSIKALRSLMNDMFNKDISLDQGTYSLLIHGLCRNKKLEQSCLFFEEMICKGFTPRRDTYKMLIGKLEREKTMGRMEARIRQLMAKGVTMEHPVMNSVAK